MIVKNRFCARLIRRVSSSPLSSTKLSSATTLDANEITKTSKWDSLDSQREIIRHAENKLGITSMSDWYNISYKTLRSKCVPAANMVTYKYSSSVQSCIMTLFSDHTWEPWEFHHLPAGWWLKPENRSQYLQWLCGQLGIQSPQDWYSVSYLQIKERGGKALFKQFKTVLDLAQSMYPNHEFLAWSFATTPRTWWSSVSNQRQFLDYCLKASTGSSDLAGWYATPKSVVYDYGGESMLREYYASSLSQCLQSVYPEHSWNMLAMNKSRHNPETALPSANVSEWKRSLVLQVAASLSIESPEQWYTISTAVLRESGGLARRLAVPVCQRLQWLQLAYPEHSWSKWKFYKKGCRSFSGE